MAKSDSQPELDAGAGSERNGEHSDPVSELRDLAFAAHCFSRATRLSCDAPGLAEIWPDVASDLGRIAHSLTTLADRLVTLSDRLQAQRVAAGERTEGLAEQIWAAWGRSAAPGKHGVLRDGSDG